MSVFVPLSFRLGSNWRFRHRSFMPDKIARMSLAGASVNLRVRTPTGDVFSSPFQASITNSDQGESYFDIPPSTYGSVAQGTYEHEIYVLQGGAYLSMNYGPFEVKKGPLGY